MIYQNLCPTCGGELSKIDSEHYACDYCHNVYLTEKIEDYADKITKLFDEAKLELISNAKKNLYKAVTAKYISSEEVHECCIEVKKYLPDDFQANFYDAFNSKSMQEIAKMIRKIDVPSNFECLDVLLNFLIKSLETELVQDTMYLIERAYKNIDLSKYNKFSTLVSDEAEKLDDCIYATTYPRDVFVAYSSKDTEKALELVEELEEQDLSCFISIRNLRHGSGSRENYDKALKEAMDNCTSFVFVSTMNSRSQSCDALKVEISYIKKRDEKKAANVPYTTYANMPIEFKKPRVEYRLEESTRKIAADRIVDEFFAGYERVYNSLDVAERVIRQSAEISDFEISQISNSVQERLAREEEERKKAEELRRQQEAEKRRKEEQERLKREEEERKKAEQERLKLEEKFQLGEDYYYGRNGIKDCVEAVKYYRIAAEQGHAGAQNALGVCYFYGKGVNRDHNEAVKWFRLAADQGLAKAQCNLGECYYQGRCVYKDYDQAVKLFRLAAEQGNADAQYSLGWCYVYGQGVKKNIYKAYEWYKLAAEQGHADAEKQCKKLRWKI